MAKTQRRTPISKAGDDRTQPQRAAAHHRDATGPQADISRATGSRGRRRWILGSVAIAIILAGIAVWRALPTLGGEESASAAPIASLTAPDVHSLLIDPKNPDHVLFGSHAGLQESQDGGFTWRPGTLANADAMSMSVSPKDPTTLYVAGHDVFLVSRDGGTTWQPVAHDLPGTDLHAFAQDPVDPLRLYALVVGAGVFGSADGGTAWRPLPAQPPGVAGHGALATDGTVLYAVTPSGLVLSGDEGQTWEESAVQPNGGAISLAIPAGAPKTLYAGTPSGLAKSTDGGMSWAALGPEGVPTLALAVAPAEVGRVLIVDDNGRVYRSDDGGASWIAPR